jgi:predicted DNA-binding transcriptional regulator AlpA
MQDQSAKSARKARLRMEPTSLSVDQFCDLHQISRAGFYAMRARGQAPQSFRAGGGKRRITREAEGQWVRLMESRESLRTAE